ncbi:hypothetical protein M9Y10_029590 [Tritrichomonas musculus]|uniref:Uncharacterized protein n=1 Tax=Tritrichomonas musculus TaxID=1915356 RepID=A0ABR2KML0_9EUKA
MKKIEDIPIPDNLTEIQKAEFTAYKEAMIQIEKEWEQLENNENNDQKACNAIIQDLHDRKKKKIAEKLSTRQDIIQKQHQKEKDKIEKEFKAAKTTLNDRLVRAYYSSYQNIIGQLKDLKGKDYSVDNSIDFPPIQSDPQMLTRMKQPEEPNFRLSSQDCEKDLRKIQNIFSQRENE